MRHLTFANYAFVIQAPLRSNGRRRIHDLKIGRAIEGLSFPAVPGAVIEARADFEWAWRVLLSRRAQRPIFRHGVIREDWSARKYALWDAGKRPEPPS
jgi:hypothetical protein